MIFLQQVDSSSVVGEMLTQEVARHRDEECSLGGTELGSSPGHTTY